MTKRMLYVSRTLRPHNPYNGDDTRQGITQVVDGIHHNCDGTSQDTHGRLECSQQYIRSNTNPTGTYDFL